MIKEFFKQIFIRCIIPLVLVSGAFLFAIAIAGFLTQLIK